MGTMTLPAVVASPWSAERFGNAPIAPSQGTGLPFAGTTSGTSIGMTAAAAAAKPAAAAAGYADVTAHLVAVRQDADRFRPRGPEL